MSGKRRADLCPPCRSGGPCVAAGTRFACKRANVGAWAWESDATVAREDFVAETDAKTDGEEGSKDDRE